MRVNFRIKANYANGEIAGTNKAKQVERYLAGVEQQAITNICPENQLKARLANTLEPLRSYKLLSNFKDFEVVGDTMRIYLGNSVQLSEHEKDVILSQVKSIYSGLELDIESVEYLVENACQQVNGYNPVETKKTPIMPTLQQDVWGDICRQLIERCGVHVYNNWFSRLIPVIDQKARTIELKAPNSFIQKEVIKRYGDAIKQVVSSFGLQFQEIN